MSQQNSSRNGAGGSPPSIESFGHPNKEYIRIVPSTEQFEEGSAMTHIRGLLDIKQDIQEGTLNSVPGLGDDDKKITLDLLALTEGEGRPVEVYYGADAAIQAVQDRLEEIYPTSFEIERVNLDLERKLTEPVELPVQKFVEHLKAGNLRADYEGLAIQQENPELEGWNADAAAFDDSVVNQVPLPKTDIPGALKAEQRELHEGKISGQLPSGTAGNLHSNAGESTDKGSGPGATFVRDIITKITTSRGSRGVDGHYVDTDGSDATEDADEDAADRGIASQATTVNSVEQDSDTKSDEPKGLGEVMAEEWEKDGSSVSTVDGTGDSESTGVDRYEASGEESTDETPADSSENTDHDDEDGDDNTGGIGELFGDGGQPAPTHAPVQEPDEQDWNEYNSGENDSEDYIPHYGGNIEYTPDALPREHIKNTIPLANGDIIPLFDESRLEEHGSEMAIPGPVAVESDEDDGIDKVLARPSPEGTSAVATRWRAYAKWRNDWMTTLGSDTRSPGSQANRGTMMSEKSADEDFNLPEAESKLGTVLNQLTQSDAPLAFQVTIRRKDSWKKKQHRRKVDVEDNTETIAQKTWNLFIRGGASRKDHDSGDLAPNQERRLQLMRAKTPKKTWNMNIRAVSPLTAPHPDIIDGSSDITSLDDDIPPEAHERVRDARTTMNTLQNSLNDLSGEFYQMDSEILTAESAWGRNNTNAVTEYKSLLDRKVTVGNGETSLLRKIGTGERYYPHFVVNPNELLPLFVIPPEEALPSEVYRNTIERQQSENPLPRPNPDLLDDYRDGLPLGYPIDQQGYPEDEPVCLPESNLTTHIARFATTGSGKSIAVQNDLLHLDESVPGPTVVIDPKGDGLSDEFLQAYYREHTSFDNVYHFKAPELLPALSFFDIRPQLASGKTREDAIQSKVRQFHETMAMVMGREEYESAYAAKDVISFLITALFDKGNNRSREDANGNPIPGPYDDAFTLDDLYDAAQRMAQDRMVPAAPHSDRDIEKILTRQFAKTDQSFQNSMSAVLNRFEKVMQDPQLYRAMNHVPKWNHNTGDYADDANVFDFRSIIEDDDAIVLFDLGAMDEGKHEFAAVVLSVLWDAIQKRVMDQNDDYEKIVNIVIEEAAPMVGTKLLSEDLIPQARSFGVSLELIMQFPEQVRHESERALNELYNDIQTKIFGNIELEAEASEVLSTDTKPPEEMENKLQQLPPGEWVTSLPATEFYGQVPTPFSTQALDIPEGHPESDNPLTVAEQQRFANEYQQRWDDILVEYAADHPETADANYYDSDTGESGASAPITGTSGQNEEGSDPVTAASSRSTSDQGTTGEANSDEGPTDQSPVDSQHHEAGEQDITDMIGRKSEDEDGEEELETAQTTASQGTSRDQQTNSETTTESSAGGASTEADSDPDSSEDTGAGVQTDDGEPQTETSSTKEEQPEAPSAEDTESRDESAKAALARPGDLPQHIEVADDGHYQCNICESRYAPSKPAVAAECCHYDSPVEGEDVIGYIAQRHGTGKEHTITVTTVFRRLQSQGFEDVSEKHIYSENFHDHTDESADLPARVSYEDPGRYRCEVCRSIYTAGRWRDAVDCCAFDSATEATHVVQGVFLQHDTERVDDLPDDQLAALVRALASSGVDATLEDLSTLSKPQSLEAASWWGETTAPTSDSQSQAADTSTSGSGEDSNTTEDTTSPEADSDAATASTTDAASESDSDTDEGSDAPIDAEGLAAIGFSVDADEDDSVTGEAESGKARDLTLEALKQKEAEADIRKDEDNLRQLVAHALADEDHPQLADYDLTQSMTTLEDKAGDPNVELLKEFGYIEEIDTYRKKYYDLTDSGWLRTEGVTKPTEPGEGDAGEDAAHRVGVERAANHLRKQDDIVEIKKYHQPEEGAPVYDVVGFDSGDEIKAAVEVEMWSKDYEGIVDDYQALRQLDSARKIWAVEDQDVAEAIVRAFIASDQTPSFYRDPEQMDSFRRLGELRDWVFSDDKDKKYYPGMTQLLSIRQLDYKPPEADGGDGE